MSEPRKIRDPVHDFISLSGKEAEIVSTPIFQRLRGIRQLALANLVYPGALHTRFEHSIGVCHISGLLAESLKLNEEDKELVRIAALVHDLGHGPFSHVSENALECYADRDKIKLVDGKKDKIHELITAEIICKNPELKRLIGEKGCEDVVKLLSMGYGEPVLRAIVSGPLDADKQDYLLRDSYFCGVKYGIFDMHQLHRELRAVEDPTDNSKQLMISPDGTHAVEQFVMAKYYLTTQVLCHRVRIVTDQMLFRAIRLGVEVDKTEELLKLFKYDGSEEFLSEYIKWDDARFFSFFGDARFDGTYCYKFLKRLSQRKLLKRIYSKKLFELPKECREPISEISSLENMKIRDDIENKLYEAIKRVCNGNLEQGSDDPKLVVIHSFKIKSVREQSRNDEGPILVEKPNGPIQFESESALFRSINEEMNEAFVEVYAPVIYDTPTDRKMLLNKLEGSITEVLSNCFENKGVKQ